MTEPISKELITERRKLLRRLWLADCSSVRPGARNTKGLDALMALNLFDLRNPDVAKAFENPNEATVLP